MKTNNGSRNAWGIGRTGGIVVALWLGIFALVPYVHAAGQAMLVKGPEGSYQLVVNKAGIIQLNEPVKRVAVANDGIAQIKVLPNGQLYVLGKSLGTTNIVAWDRHEQIIDDFNVEVTYDLETLKRKLFELMPDEHIAVYAAQGKIILQGRVSTLEKANAAAELAGTLCEGNTPIIANVGHGTAATGARGESQQSGPGGGPGCVINMLQIAGAQQVMLQVKVAEIDRTALKSLTSNVNILNFGSSAQVGLVSGGATFPNAQFQGGTTGGEIPVFGGGGTQSLVGPVISKIQPNNAVINDTGAFLSALSGNFLFRMALDVSRQKGLAKILAEPTLTTLSGQEAQFLSGGEFPIPVPQGGTSNAITIEFKSFGVGVHFLPTVLGPDRINLKLNVSVTELSAANSIAVGVAGTTGTTGAATFSIPSLTRRSTQSTVELADGQTIGIAGLINDTTRSSVTKFPGLGDLPVLGALFRDQSFQTGKTELVIFVTPHLARPISPSEVRLPTDAYVPPSDKEFFLEGRLESKNIPNTPPPAPASTGGTGPKAADFGHEY